MSDLDKSIEQIKATVGDRLIYLASPYSHAFVATRILRFEIACKAAAMLTWSGMHVFAPIVHSHPMAQYGLAKDWEFWEVHDRLFLEACGGMIVATIPGWQQSKGIAAEMQIMVDMDKPVWFLSARSNCWPSGDIVSEIIEHDTDWIINP